MVRVFESSPISYHNSFASQLCGSLKNPHTCRKEWGAKFPVLWLPLFSSACKRLRVYEATKVCEQPLKSKADKGHRILIIFLLPFQSAGTPIFTRLSQGKEKGRLETVFVLQTYRFVDLDSVVVLIVEISTALIALRARQTTRTFLQAAGNENSRFRLKLGYTVKTNIPDERFTSEARKFNFSKSIRVKLPP